MTHSILLRMAISLQIAFCLTLFLPAQQAAAEVKSASESGFRLVIVRQCTGDLSDCETHFLKNLADWWLPAHTYSGDSKNLSINWEKRCLEETLPQGGFVRHMEVKQYHPGNRLVMTGGLGPLQEMGLYGAMTISWTQQGEGKCQVTMTYNVTGYSADGLQALAPVVDSVLSQQMDSFKAHTDGKN